MGAKVSKTEIVVSVVTGALFGVLGYCVTKKIYSVIV